jgi:hypothetical protein
MTDVLSLSECFITLCNALYQRKTEGWNKANDLDIINIAKYLTNFSLNPQLQAIAKGNLNRIEIERLLNNRRKLFEYFHGRDSFKDVQQSLSEIKQIKDFFDLQDCFDEGN